jgi:hypothetical protein
MANDDKHYLSLIMKLVTGARNNKELYRITKKEIKRLMLEDKEARDFFQKALGSIKV